MLLGAGPDNAKKIKPNVQPVPNPMAGSEPEQCRSFFYRNLIRITTMQFWQTHHCFKHLSFFFLALINKTKLYNYSGACWTKKKVFRAGILVLSCAKLFARVSWEALFLQWGGVWWAERWVGPVSRRITHYAPVHSRFLPGLATGLAIGLPWVLPFLYMPSLALLKFLTLFLGLTADWAYSTNRSICL
jgi:hypothetical protein